MENEKEDFENLSTEMSDLKFKPFKDSIDNYPDDLDLDPKEVCYDICKRLYVSRHYSLDNDNINVQLRRLDRVMRDDENYN